MCEAPTLCALEMDDGKLRLTFRNAGEGLFLAAHTPDGAKTDSGRLEGLTLELDGKTIDPAEITAEAKDNTVTLYGSALHKGNAIAALGCGGWYRINLYNSAGIPARPCRLSCP